MDPSSHHFLDGRPFSLGVEEELFLVDPVTGRQINSSGGVLGRVGELPEGTVERELHACEIECITDVHLSVGEATQSLEKLRRAVTDTGAGILGAGTHPSAAMGEAQITDKDRYERIHDLLGDAAIIPVSGLHVHVGMPDAETAIRVFNGLRNHLPLLQALSANSPFRHGRDTGLASAREMSLRAWPRSGVPRAFESYADFCAMAAEVSAAAEVPDYTWFWWKIRPHPRLGTVEVRSMDAQTSLDDVGALTALVHCLARRLADADPAPGTSLGTELLEENIFRAGRWGVAARLAGPDGEHRTVAELLAATLDQVADQASELDCVAELGRLPDLVAAGGGAGRQREIFSVGGIDAVTRTLTEWTSAR